MISSGWSGLLQTLSLLFEVAPDEVTVASVLDTMIALTGPAKFIINPSLQIREVKLFFQHLSDELFFE